MYELEIVKFAELMLKRPKKDWHELPTRPLVKKLFGSAWIVGDCLGNDDSPEEVEEACVDLANYAMMLAQNYRRDKDMSC